MAPWIVYANVLGLRLAAGHGVAAPMAFRLRSERDPAWIAAILDFSLWQLSQPELQGLESRFVVSGRGQFALSVQSVGLRRAESERARQRNTGSSSR